MILNPYSRHTNDMVLSKFYDNQNDFRYEIIYFPDLDGDFPCSLSYDINVSQLIFFARVCSNDKKALNNRKHFLLLSC